MMLAQKRKTLIGIAVAIVIAVAIGWYVGSPRWSLRQMRSAAEARDTDRLATYIDFPALRSSMKEEFKARMAAEMEMGSGDGFQALGAMFAMNMVDNVIDGMITPASLRKIFAKDKTSGPEGVTAVDASGSDVKIERLDFNTFRLVNPKDKQGAGLIFKRDGLGWKLTSVRLP